MSDHADDGSVLARSSAARASVAAVPTRSSLARETLRAERHADVASAPAAALATPPLVGRGGVLVPPPTPPPLFVRGDFCMTAICLLMVDIWCSSCDIHTWSTGDEEAARGDDDAT